MLKTLQSILRQRNRHRLLYRLLFAVVICSTFFTILATAVQLYFSFQTDLNAIENKFEIVRNSYVPAIGTSLYQVNIEQLEIQLKGILQLTDMVYVEVREPRGEDVFILSEGDPEAIRDMVREYPLSYRKPSGDIVSYGNLLLAASLDKAWARLWDRVLIVLATNGAMTFLAALCILLVFHFLLIRHLTRITRHVSGWDPNTRQSKLTLNRTAASPEKADELDSLVNAIDTMQSKTIEYIAERQAAIEGLKTSENQMRVITDSLPVLLSYIDMTWRYRFANKAYHEWFGIRQDQIPGRPVRDILGEDLYETIHPHLMRALQGEKTTFETEITKNGRNYLFEVVYVPDTSLKERISGVFALWYDLSEKIHKEMELKRHREELSHVSRVATMGELTASMAHELNQPLTAVLSNAQAALRFIEKDPVDIQEIKDILMDIAADDRRASEVIKRLRSFLSRGELVMKTRDMNEIIREVVTLVHSDAVMRNVSIRMDLESELPEVEVDRVQMQQVLLNLIINGLDVLNKVPADARTLTVTSRKQNSENIQVRVADSGIGLDAANIPRLFEPFFTTKPEGMGMGLSINRSIIEAHNGSIWADNAPDGGAMFCFSLPLKRIEHSTSNAEQD